MSEELTHELNARHEYVSYKHVYDVPGYIDIIEQNPNRDLVLERGALSSYIYTHARAGVMSCEDWSKPQTLDDFAAIAHHLDVYVIIYASDASLLSDRLMKRARSSHRAPTQQELDEIELTNYLFASFGRLISTRCNNLLMIDACEERGVDELAESVLDFASRVSGAEPVPRNDRG